LWIKKGKKISKEIKNNVRKKRKVFVLLLPNASKNKNSDESKKSTQLSEQR
jgi:hypothetical protein